MTWRILSKTEDVTVVQNDSSWQKRLLADTDEYTKFTFCNFQCNGSTLQNIN